MSGNRLIQLWSFDHTFYSLRCRDSYFPILDFKKSPNNLYLYIELGSFIRQTRIHQYLCRYCREPQVNHAALREHTLQHVENGDIQFKKTKMVEREEKEIKNDLKEENGMDFEEGSDLLEHSDK